MRPAARVGDPTSCPVHGAVPLLGPGQPDVLVNGLPVMRRGDGCTCPPQAEVLLQGHPLVLTGGSPTCGLGHPLTHGGMVIGGSPDVLLGSPPLDDAGNVFTPPPECVFLLDTMDIDPQQGKQLDRLRSPVALSAPEPVTRPMPPNADTTDKSFPAKKTTVTVRGRTITIIEPAAPAPAPPAWRPTTEEVARGHATLSDAQLDGIGTVVVVPTPPKNGSPAECYPPRDGEELSTINYYERTEPHPQADVDWVLLHEGAHALQNANKSVMENWKDAIASDGHHPSDYARSGGVKEDFAESVVMFALTKGTPCEETARRAFPRRYQALERIFPDGFPKRKS